MTMAPLEEAIADAILANLKEIFGWNVYDILTKKIMQNYLNNRMDIRTAIIREPAIFESAFLGLIGPLGEKFLADVCEKVQSDLALDRLATYSRIGDLERYVTVVSQGKYYN